MFDLDYVNERRAELRNAIEKATIEGRDDSFNFYRGQLHVWDALAVQLKAVA